MTQASAQETQTSAADKKSGGTTTASSGGAGGGASAVQRSLRGQSFDQQEAMLRPVQRKRAGGGADAKPVQRTPGDDAPTETPADTPAGAPPQGADAKKTAPPIAYSVPQVVAVAQIANPVARNQAINQSYHAFDTAMTAYLGEPLVSNWCTYGQHASREAGAQIKNLQAAKGLIADIGAHLADFQSAALGGLSVWNFLSQLRAAWSIARRAYHDVKVIIGLLGEEGLVKQSVKLWMARAGIGEDELTSIKTRFAAIADMDISDVGFSTARDVYNTVVDTINIGIRLATGIPALLDALTLIYDNMCKGNREIYENIAPAYASFLQAGLVGNGVVGGMGFGGDTRGFLGAAFAKYSQVREKANQLYEMDEGDANRGTVSSQRTQIAHQANLTIGYQEQLVVLQPIFDTMWTELNAMSGTMVLRDPNGTHPLVGGWQDFYTRMGLDPAKTPPLDQINANNLGELAGFEQRAGSISRYFEDYLTNKKVHNAPTNISEHG